MGLKTPDYIPAEEMEKLYIPTGLAPTDQFQPLDIPMDITPKKP